MCVYIYRCFQHLPLCTLSELYNIIPYNIKMKGAHIGKIWVYMYIQELRYDLSVYHGIVTSV